MLSSSVPLLPLKKWRCWGSGRILHVCRPYPSMFLTTGFTHPHTETAYQPLGTGSLVFVRLVDKSQGLETEPLAFDKP